MRSWFAARRPTAKPEPKPQPSQIDTLAAARREHGAEWVDNMVDEHGLQRALRVLTGKMPSAWYDAEVDQLEARISAAEAEAATLRTDLSELDAQQAEADRLRDLIPKLEMLKTFDLGAAVADRMSMMGFEPSDNPGVEIEELPIPEPDQS